MVGGMPTPAPSDKGLTLTPEAMREDVSAASNFENPTADQRIIKTGSLELSVEDVSVAIADITSRVTTRNGFIQSSNTQDPGDSPRRAWMTVRVPVSAFQEMMEDIKKMAVVVLDEAVEGQDVTMQYIDLQAALKNARAEEESYIQLLKRTGSVEEILAVTRQLAEVRGRIERYDAQKRYLESKTDMATISVQMTEETRVNVPGKTWQPLEVLRQSLSGLIHSLQGLIDLLIRLVVVVIGLLLPIALIAGFVFWLGWKIKNFIQKKMKK